MPMPMPMPLPMPMELRKGQLPVEQLGPYRLIAPIGKGASGTVFRAENTRLGREVAVKLLDPATLALPSAKASQRMFLNEAKLAAMLRHPNIVTIYDAASDNGMFYIAMESIFNGRSLQRHCKSAEDRFSLEEAVALVQKCANGLQHAHERGIVHRDIKPRNILLDRGNEPRIVDFGLALVVRGDATMTYLLGAGSPLYMSPEQILDESLSQQTDIFSLGVVLYELVTGVHPFSGRNLSEVLTNVVDRPHLRLRKLNAGVPKVLEQVVDRALAKQRARRYSTARDFAADLDLVLDVLRAGRTTERLRRKFELARPLPFFRAFDDDELREVTRASSVRRFGEGEEIVAEGERSSSFFFVLAGRVAVRRGRVQLASLGRGACVGEMAALTERPRTASVVALEPTLVLMAPRSVLDETTPGCRLKLKDAFLAILVGRLEHTLGLLPGQD